MVGGGPQEVGLLTRPGPEGTHRPPSKNRVARSDSCPRSDPPPSFRGRSGGWPGPVRGGFVWSGPVRGGFAFGSCAVRRGFVFGPVLGVGPLASVGGNSP